MIPSKSKQITIKSMTDFQIRGSFLAQDQGYSNDILAQKERYPNDILAQNNDIPA